MSFGVAEIYRLERYYSQFPRYRDLLIAWIGGLSLKDKCEIISRASVEISDTVCREVLTGDEIARVLEEGGEYVSKHYPSFNF